MIILKILKSLKLSLDTFRTVFPFLFSFLLAFPFFANAICASPAGTAGQMQWVAASSKVMWCNGTSWINPVNATNLSCTGTTAGTISVVSSGGADLQFCDGTFWQSMKGTSQGLCAGYSAGESLYDTTAQAMKFCDGVYWRFMYTAATPVVNSLNLNAGAASTTNNFLQVSLTASVTDSASVINSFCLKYSTTGSVPTAPLSGDSCWVTVNNNPSPGITPAASISFSNYSYLIGWSPATYAVYAWVQTGTGIISSLSATGAGTSGVDKKSIIYGATAPPAVINVLSASSDAPSSPMTTADLTIAAGANVFIKWKASATAGFGATPITLSYTTDEVTYTQIATNITNAANTGCTVDGVIETGCYKWTAGSPASTYFKVRVSATDVNSLTASTSGSPNNMSSFKILAGNTDPGLNSSAASAIIFASTNLSFSDAKSLVVTGDGKFFVRDINRGILWVDPSDGKLKTFIPWTGAYTDGPIGTATLGSSNSRMTLDFQGRLLIYDAVKIRRVDLATNQVTTLIGGGASTSSGVAATSLALSCTSLQDIHCLLTALPNGDIYFSRVGAQQLVNGGNGVIWKYSAADGNVYSYTPNGTGTTGYASLPIATSWLNGFAIDFNTATSAINKFYGYFQEQPCSNCGLYMRPAELNTSTWTSTGGGHLIEPASGSGEVGTGTAMDGHIYQIAGNSRSLYRYEVATNTWTKLIGGTSNFGACADGTAATSCNTYLQDAFITSTGQIFFLDNGLIRTIDGSGNVKTLFGQRKSYGDGGLASSARFNQIWSLDISTTTGKIAILDYNENLLREFTVGGNISTLMGDSTSGLYTSGSAASTQPINGGYWGNQYQIYFDSSNDDIFFPGYSAGGISSIGKYERSTGKSLRVIGGGATLYSAGDGLTGTNIGFPSYVPQIIGFDGSKLLVVNTNYNGTNYTNNYWKFYDKTTSFTQSQFAGNANAYAAWASMVIPADGAAVSTATVIAGFANQQTRGYWNAAAVGSLTANTWYFAQLGTSVIRSLPVGGNVGTLVTLPRSLSNGWTMAVNASNQVIVYYCSAGRMYKYNVSTVTERALPWPSASIACGGYVVNRSASRNSVIFPFAQNGLMGIAEIVDTP